MRTRKFKTLVCDFETTVFEGQTYTEVWASACVELFTEDVKIFHSLPEQFEYWKSLNSNVMVYFHNLKFDGTFILDYLIRTLQMEQALDVEPGEEEYALGHWLTERNMKNNTFKYSISDMGQWYTIIIKTGGYIIEIRDSLKLLPFSVKRIGESFKTKHKKLEMEYKGFRYAGCEITPEEQAYIANDVLVVKEALEIMYNEGHSKLTIGSCCLAEYTSIVGGKDAFESLFPNMYEIPIDEEVYGAKTAGDYIRRSYKGGWCYLCKGKENKLYHGGTTADVNSLYPSVMSSESGSKYPIGNPTFWSGNYIPDEALADNKYYFVRIRTRFNIKPGKLPFIQIKGNLLYKATEALETSDIYYGGKYYKEIADKYGNIKTAVVTLTLTMTDYILFREHYDVDNFEILDGCYFTALIGLFDEYINKYKKIKMESKGARRELAKLFLNNLYGKMASNTDSSFKVGYLREDINAICFYPVTEHEKKPGYIPVGSAITSYARNFTIRAAQMNYHGKDNPGFIYADTDSIHCDLPPEEIKGIKVDDRNFCCWKLESCWDTAIFTRQKTYIEHVTHENLEPIENPYYNVKCAGMPQKCKDLFVKSMTGYELTEEDKEKYSEDEINFLKVKRTINDFTIGLKVPGKLLPKRITGGTVLVDTFYEMR